LKNQQDKESGAARPSTSSGRAGKKTKLVMSITIKLLEARDIQNLADVFLNTVWKTPESFFKTLLDEQEISKRVVLVAYAGNELAGYVTIKWQSEYPLFAEKSIPEINDLRVLPEFRRRGVATALVDEAERRIFKRSPVAGIGVGLYPDYGPAQRMYVLRGYVPDGLGISYKNQPVRPGSDVCVDDELILYFTKEYK
jgi:ribosomal protein S18 acetylase RimI-like enzyme